MIDKIQQQLDSGGGGAIVHAVSDWLIGVVRAAFNNITSFLSPGTSGAFPYIQADPSWLETLAASTANTLWLHRSKIIWIYTSYVRAVQLSLESSIILKYNEAILYAQSVDRDARQYALALMEQEHTFAFQVEQNYEAADRQITNNLNASIRALTTAVNTSLTNLFDSTRTSITDAITTAKTYTDRSVSSLSAKLTASVLALTASIAALSAFLTTTFIPDAIAAAVAALNAEAALAMDVEWEIVATQGNRALAELGLADLDPSWAADILSEIPATSLAAADADMTSALRLVMDYLVKAGVPLYRNLKQFGEDESELDGVITTVVLGAFATAAVTEPGATATAVVDVLGDPLVDVLQAVSGLIGLT
jgi:hypothetical protein